MSISFDDIPFEVLLNFIMPHISMKEVGALAMVSPIWRDMCNDNEIWKVLYLRTVRAKVTDASVHIGAPCRRIHIGRCQKGIYKWKPYQPFTQGRDLSHRWSMDLLHCGSGCKCIPNELRDKLLPWKDVRTDGIQTNEFAITVHTPGTTDLTGTSLNTANTSSRNGVNITSPRDCQPSICVNAPNITCSILLMYPVTAGITNPSRKSRSKSTPLPPNTPSNGRPNKRIATEKNT